MVVTLQNLHFRLGCLVQTMMSFSFLLMMLTLGAGVTEAGKLVYAVIETEADLVCPDEAKHCSSDNTCCQSTSGQWECCPYAEASTDKPSAIISKYLMDEKIYQFAKHFMSARVHTIVFIFVNSISKTFPQAQDTNLFAARCHHIWRSGCRQGRPSPKTMMHIAYSSPIS